MTTTTSSAPVFVNVEATGIEDFGDSIAPGTVAFIVCIIIVAIGFAAVGILYAKSHGKQEEMDEKRRSQNAAERARAAAADAEIIARQDDEDELLLLDQADYLVGAARTEFKTPARGRSGTTTARNAADLDDIIDMELRPINQAATIADYNDDSRDGNSSPHSEIDESLL